MSHNRNILVLGAGLSGLTAARALLAAGERLTVLEAAPRPGGLTRSIQVGRYSFDYTGHLLHLTRSTSPSGIPYAGLKDEEWVQVQRRSFCYLNGSLVPAPIQYHLGALSEPIRTQCVDSFRARPPAGNAPQTFEQYLISGFGEELSRVFLIPQNEKTLGTDLTRLSERAIRRFFPLPVSDLVEAGIVNGSAGVDEYNSRFWYPREGGIDRLVHGLENGVDSIRLRAGIQRLDLDKRTATTTRGESFGWDLAFSSIPLKKMCEISLDPLLRDLGHRLTHSSTICFNIGIRGQLPNELEGIHWIYVPDRATPFYRVGFYSNFTSGTCQAGFSSAYIEVGLDSRRVVSSDVHGALLARVLRSLDSLGWIRRESIDCITTTVIDCAYVHHTHDRDEVVRSALDRLRAHGIIMVGRYGLWDYISMEDSIYSSIDAVNGALS